MTAAIARVQAMLNQAAAKPLQSQITGQPGDAALLLNGVASALYSKSYWPYLRLGLTAAFEGNGSVLVELGDAARRAEPERALLEPDRGRAGRGLPRPPVAAQPAALADAAASAARAAPMFGAGDHVGQPAVRVLAGATGGAGAAARGGRAADPRGGQHAGPGHAVPLGQGARRTTSSPGCCSAGTATGTPPT